MQQTRLQRLTGSALLIALSIIATRFLSIQTPIVRIGFGGVPIILAGLLFGPGWGFAVGALADLIGFFAFPTGAYFPGFTLSSGLAGAIAPLLLREDRNCSFWKLLLAITISRIITSLVLGTYWVTILTGKTAWVLLPQRIINQVVNIPLTTMIVFALRKALSGRFVTSVLQ